MVALDAPDPLGGGGDSLLGQNIITKLVRSLKTPTPTITKEVIDDASVCQQCTENTAPIRAANKEALNFPVSFEVLDQFFHRLNCLSKLLKKKLLKRSI